MYNQLFDLTLGPVKFAHVPAALPASTLATLVHLKGLG